MGKPIDFGVMLHGGDYNPEQWLDMPEILAKDVEYFKKAHINEVSVGIFSWSTLEPEEGVFCLDWMESLLDRMHENGIRVMLATPSAARPKWMADRYPEILRVDPYGRRAWFGGRHNHCYTSAVYREKVKIINTALAKRFGKHPAVVAWHISNEYGGAPYPCYCPLCRQAFRGWLKERYQTVDRLNRAWATTFWSHTYNSFDQVEPPSPRGEESLHGLNADWMRFVTDRTVDFMKAEIQAVREAGSDLPVTTNLMYDFKGLNYQKIADAVDFVSWDAYPLWHSGEERLTAMDFGMQHDMMRGYRRQPFFLMESCPSATNWCPVSKLKRPGVLLAQSMQAVAHGADSVQYFQLRQSRGSSEKFHGAVIDHYGGDDTRVFREVTRVGEWLEKLDGVRGSMPDARTAVIYDTENAWLMEDAKGPRNAGLHYKEAALKIYGGFRRLGLDVDVITEDMDFSGYAIVAAPMLYLFKQGFDGRVRAFVEAGGTFVLTYWSGIVDESDLCFLGGTPHGLMDVVGLRSAEIDALYDGETNTARPVSGNSLGLNASYRASTLCELVKTDTAEELMTYGEDFYAGLPALTENPYGKGMAYYVCADFEQAFYDDFAKRLADRAGIEPPLARVPEGVEVTTRRKDGTVWIFIQNYNRKPVDVSLPEGYEIVLGEGGGRIAPFGMVVLKGGRK